MGAAVPDQQVPAATADPAAVDAWRLVCGRLRGGSPADFTPSSDADGHSSRILGWLVEIAAAGMASREHDQGRDWADAFAVALRTAEERLAAAKTAPDLQALARLTGASTPRRAPRPPRRARGRR